MRWMPEFIIRLLPLYIMVAIILLVASMVTALFDLLTSKADIVFIVLSGTTFLGYHIINAAPGNNSYADEFGLGEWANTAVWSYPAVVMVMSVLTFIFGYAPIFVAIGVTGILVTSYICYRIEKPNWPSR